jgi:HD-like signal output (HDOD) protein
VILKRFATMLHGLFRSDAPRADGAAERAARLEAKVLRLVDNMPTLPDTATKAIALADDPHTKFADFARLIEGDAALATALLRVANSAFYAGGAPAVKLQQAVVRLGMLRCKNLILAVGMKSLFQKMAGDTRAQCETLWQHGYLTGWLCRRLNHVYRLGFHGEEFSAGLLHDLGRVLIALADRDCFERIGGLDFREEPGILPRERAAIGIDHSTLGGWFGEHCRLPEILVRAMWFHHRPDLDGEQNQLVALVATADDVANHLQRGDYVETYDLNTNPGLPHLWARWPEARKERLCRELPALMAEACDAAATAETPA